MFTWQFKNCLLNFPKQVFCLECVYANISSVTVNCWSQNGKVATFTVGKDFSGGWEPSNIHWASEILRVCVCRHRQHRGHHDPRAQRSWDLGLAGAAHRDHPAHHHRNAQPAEVREQDVGRVRLHLLHHPHDHLPGLARLLLHPEVPLRQRTQPQPGTTESTQTKRVRALLTLGPRGGFFHLLPMRFYGPSSPDSWLNGNRASWWTIIRLNRQCKYNLLPCLY